MWPNSQETADLATFAEEILNGKLHFFVQCDNFISVKDFFSKSAVSCGFCKFAKDIWTRNFIFCAVIDMKWVLIKIVIIKRFYVSGDIYWIMIDIKWLISKRFD